jgi:hypothetical protein
MSVSLKVQGLLYRISDVQYYESKNSNRSGEKIPFIKVLIEPSPKGLIEITFFGRKSKLVKYMELGRVFEIECTLTSRPYNKKPGIYITTLVGDRIFSFPAKSVKKELYYVPENQEENAHYKNQKVSNVNSDISGPIDDLPF